MNKEKRICLKCKKLKPFPKKLENSLVCGTCLPSEKNMQKANEIISTHFKELGKKSWEIRKSKLLASLDKPLTDNKCCGRLPNGEGWGHSGACNLTDKE